MLGKWIQPWPGERLYAEVVAVEGGNLHCRTINGDRFEIPLTFASRLVVSDSADQAFKRMNCHVSRKPTGGYWASA